MANGKKLYTTNEIQAACDVFASICSKLAEKFGQTADECGEAYLLYGKCLLDIARSESDVLGSSVSKVEASTSQVISGNGESEGDVSEEKAASIEINGTKENGLEEKMDEDEEKESESEEKESKKEANSTESDDKEMSEDEKKETTEDEDDKKETTEGEDDKKETTEDEDDKKETTEDEDDKKETTEDEETSDNAEQEAEGEENDEGEEEDGDEDEGEPEEDVSTMQQAWEILELCRIVFARRETKEHKLKQAEANLLLGEIGMEQEHYPEAVGDFMECLRIQEKYLDPSDRLLAVTFYNLGLAYSFDRHYGKAIEYFSKAVDVIKSRIENINKEADESSKSSELKELQELLPEMTAKIEDAEYMKKSTEEIVKSAALMARESLESSSFDEPTMDTNKEGESEKKVNNISNLVRKKRKTDDNKEDETASKRTKETDQATES